jgi:hypothetical protein
VGGRFVLYFRDGGALTTRAGSASIGSGEVASIGEGYCELHWTGACDIL